MVPGPSIFSIFLSLSYWTIFSLKHHKTERHLLNLFFYGLNIVWYVSNSCFINRKAVFKNIFVFLENKKEEFGNLVMALKSWTVQCTHHLPWNTKPLIYLLGRNFIFLHEVNIIFWFFYNEWRFTVIVSFMI